MADRFTYDPTTDTFRCPEGHVSAHRTTEGSRTRYSFSASVCPICPAADACPPQNAGRVRLTVSEYHLARLRGTPASMPLVEYERKRIERKFGQAKTNHGLRRARSLGKATLLIQGLLTFFVVNAKRWVRLLDLRATRAACAPPALA